MRKSSLKIHDFSMFRCGLPRGVEELICRRMAPVLISVWMFFGLLPHAFGAENRLANPAFDIKEADPAEITDWTQRPRANSGESDPRGVISLDSTNFVSAPQSLRITHDDSRQYTWIQQLVDVEPETTYILHAMVKAENLETSQGGYGPRIYVSRNKPSPYEQIAAVPANQFKAEWKEVTLRFNSTNCTQIAVGLYIHKASGSVWFDDLQLIRADKQ